MIKQIANVNNFKDGRKYVDYKRSGGKKSFIRKTSAEEYQDIFQINNMVFDFVEHRKANIVHNDTNVAEIYQLITDMYKQLHTAQ